MRNVSIETEYIRLDQALKLAEITGSGGESKMLILEGLVRVNGKPETRRGRKLVPDDVVETEGEAFRIEGS